MKKIYKAMPLVMLAIIGLLQQANAQAYKSYTVDTIPFLWEDFTTTAATEQLAIVGEDEVYPIQLPFPFRYFDSTYTTAFVSVNGNIQFGRSYAQSDFNREKLCMPVAQLYDPAGEQTTLNPDNFIAVFWDDLFIQPLCTPTDGTPQLAYRTIGTAPNRQLIVVWQNVFSSANLADCATDPTFGALLSVEARIYEGSNVVEVHIKKNLLLEQGATVAVENLDGSYAKYVSCGAGNSPGEQVGYRFTPSELPDSTGTPIGTYCQAKGEDCITNPALDYIVTATIDSKTGQIINNSACDAGYGDFSAVDSLIAYWEVDSIYTATILREITYVFGLGSAWVDWNDDKDFDDLGEEFIGLSTSAIDGMVTFVIQVPNGTSSGFKRLRFRTSSGAVPLACDDQTLGEVEDYTVFVNNPAAPLPLCVDSIMPNNGATSVCTKLTLRWNQVSDATAYKVSFGKANPFVASITDSLVSDTFLVLPNELLVSTQYQWLVTPVNENGEAIGCDSLFFNTATEYDPIVNILPAGDTLFVCQNGNVVLDANTQFGLAPLTYSWNGSNNTLLSDTAITTPTFMATTLGPFVYGVSAKGANNCTSNIDSVQIKVVPNALAGQLSTTTPSICADNTVILSLDAYQGNVSWESSTDGVLYSPGIAITAIDEVLFVTPRLQDNIYIRAKIAAGDCNVNSNEILISVNPLPAKPLVTALGTPLYCTGTPVILVSDYNNGIVWNDDLNTINDTLVVNNNGTYVATYTDGNGCMANAAPFIIAFNPKPAKPVVSQTSNTTLQASAVGTNYQWFGSNGLIPGATAQNFMPVLTGIYKVVAYNAAGCASDSSAAFSFTAIGISENANTRIRIYPNPSKGKIQIDGLEKIENARIEVLDLLGKKLANKTLGTDNTIDLQLAPGTYFLRIKQGEEGTVRRIVIQE